MKLNRLSMVLAVLAFAGFLATSLAGRPSGGGGTRDDGHDHPH